MYLILTENKLLWYFFREIGLESSVTMWKLLQFSLTHFWQTFRESNVFTKQITKN